MRELVSRQKVRVHRLSFDFHMHVMAYTNECQGGRKEEKEKEGKMERYIISAF